MKLFTTRLKILFPVFTLFLLLSASMLTWPLQYENVFGSTSSFRLNESFLTKDRAFISLVNSSSNGTVVNDNANSSAISSNNTIKAMIASGDTLSNNYNFAKIPDGLGAVQVENGTVDVFVNHELENETDEGGFAKVSKLRLNQTDGSIIGAELVIDGDEEYKRLCSASLVEGYGFEHPIFFTNEEVEDGLVLAIDAINGTVTEMPWLGLFSHENTIHIPTFSNTINKTAILSFEDGEPTESEVYMYLADTPKDLLSGKGQLYVFGVNTYSASSNASSKATSNQSSLDWDDMYFSNGTVNGRFI